MRRKIALMASNEKFVSADRDLPNTPLVANRDAIKPWEIFELIELDSTTPPPSLALWRGCTDFRLAQALANGEDIQSLLNERKSVGANLVRTLAMKTNNTGWQFYPQSYSDYWGNARRFFDLIGANNLRCEWTIFADTRSVMPDFSQQREFYDRTVEVVRAYPFVYLELCNEWNHSTQLLDPQQFPRPNGIYASHGSGLSDEDTVQPRWDYAAYHARRDIPKAFTNYDPYEFQSVYPQPVPLIPDEGIKPETHYSDPEIAQQLGLHAACGWGGTFHSNAGVNSRPFSSIERSCAEAFFKGLGE